MIKITVLGGSGFLGSSLSDYLSSTNKYKVIILDLKKKKLKKNQKFVKGSILDSKKLHQSIRGSKYVFNFAALADLDKSINKPLETAKINIIGTINSLILSKKYKIKKYIQASSIYANSEQGGFYGASKKAAEDYIERFSKKFNLNYSILRFGSLYGPNAGPSNGINKIIQQYKKEKILMYKGKKNSTRRYIHVNDACKVCQKSLSSKYDNKYLIVTGRKKIKITDVMKYLSQIYNYKKKIHYQNLEIEGHYTKEPKKFIPRSGKNLFIKKYKKLDIELKKLVNSR